MAEPSKRGYLKELSVCHSRLHLTGSGEVSFFLGICFKVYFEHLPPKPVSSLGSVMCRTFLILAIPFILNFGPFFANADTLSPPSHRDQNCGHPKTTPTEFQSCLCLTSCLPQMPQDSAQDFKQCSPEETWLKLVCWICLGLFSVFQKLVKCQENLDNMSQFFFFLKLTSFQMSNP